MISDDNGIESLILNGQADFGFDCKAPYDPSIAFKLVAKEDMGLVCSPKFARNLDDKLLSKYSSQYIHNFRNDLALFYDLIQKTDSPLITAHDIATVRSLLIEGFGWSFLPWYAVQEEVHNKKLLFFNHHKLEQLKYGVWWLRDRKNIQNYINTSIQWLQKVKLTKN